MSALDSWQDEEAEETGAHLPRTRMDMDEARTWRARCYKDPEHALNTLAREELGLNPDNLGSPWGAAVFSFLAFTVGAIIPLAPFLLKLGPQSVLYTAAFAGVALLWSVPRSACSPGAARSGWHAHAADRWVSGAATYAIGTLLGVSLG